MVAFRSYRQQTRNVASRPGCGDARSTRDLISTPRVHTHTQDTHAQDESLAPLTQFVPFRVQVGLHRSASPPLGKRKTQSFVFVPGGENACNNCRKPHTQNASPKTTPTVPLTTTRTIERACGGTGGLSALEQLKLQCCRSLVRSLFHAAGGRFRRRRARG